MQKQEPLEQLNIVWGMVILVLRLMAMPGEILLYKGHGYYFRKFYWIASVTGFGLVVSAYTTQAGVDQAKRWIEAGWELHDGMPWSGHATARFYLVFFVVALLRKVQAWHLERRRGWRVHSQYSGFPSWCWLLGIDESNGRRFLGPLIAAGAGCLFYFYTLEAPLGMWLWYIGGAMACKEHLLWLRERRHGIIRRDVMIESEWWDRQAQEWLNPDRQRDPYIVGSRRRRRWFG